MTILKRSEFAQQAERAVLARSGHDEGAVFAEPWEAEAFALAVKLSERGTSRGRNGRRLSPMSCGLPLSAARMTMARVTITTGWRLWRSW